MSLGLGVTLLLTLFLVKQTFKEKYKINFDIAPDCFFVGIQNGDRDNGENFVNGS